jgi:uncharacterized membrane protein (UPF0127 family)
MQKQQSNNKRLKKWLVLTLVGVVLLVGVIGAVYAYKTHKTTEPLKFTSNTTQFTADGHTFTLEIANTDNKQRLGLGKRSGLPEDHGMLFTYDNSASRCFWMKDMQFSIDIIWLDADRRVTHIEPNLSPDTYPKAYCPKAGAMYVLELRAGMAKTINLKVGDLVVLRP